MILGSSSATLASRIAGFNPSSGSGFSELSSPNAIALASDGTVYVADTGNYRVMKFTPNEPVGSVVAGGRGNGATLDKLGTSYGLALDSQGFIYVSEYGNHRITKWTNATNGTIVSIFFIEE